jgi:hypothetical protein
MDGRIANRKINGNILFSNSQSMQTDADENVVSDKRIIGWLAW